MCDDVPTQNISCSQATQAIINEMNDSLNEELRMIDSCSATTYSTLQVHSLHYRYSVYLFVYNY